MVDKSLHELESWYALYSDRSELEMADKPV